MSGRAGTSGSGGAREGSRRLTFLWLYVSFPCSSRSTTTPPPASMRVHPEASSRASLAALTHTSYSKSRNHAHPRVSTMSGMLIPASSTIMSSRLYSVKRPSAATRRRHSALFPQPRPPMRMSAGAGAREDDPSGGRARGGGPDLSRRGREVRGGRGREVRGGPGREVRGGPGRQVRSRTQGRSPQAPRRVSLMIDYLYWGLWDWGGLWGGAPGVGLGRRGWV